jgi:DNA polymerase (family 10)
MWPDEAAELVAADRSLTELRSVGPFTAALLRGWLREQREPPPPPPPRAGFLSYAQARKIVAAHPEWQAAARADHQMHTEETDGTSSIADMATAAAALGRDRIVITDHSKTLRITNGMDEARLLAQVERIDERNRTGEAGPIVLKGIEMDLSPDGVGDMDPAALARLDLVLGAFHSKLRLRDDQTDRYVKALENPDIHVLAHPRGRVYNFRLGLSCDWERVARRAGDTGTALEIDAYPDRQDLDVERLRIVALSGAWISIGTDAHTPAELAYLEIGIAAAILAGLPRERVLNGLSAAELAERIGVVRATKRASVTATSTRAKPEADSVTKRRTSVAASPRTGAAERRTPRRRGMSDRGD